MAIFPAVPDATRLRVNEELAASAMHTATFSAGFLKLFPSAPAHFNADADGGAGNLASCAKRPFQPAAGARALLRDDRPNVAADETAHLARVAALCLRSGGVMDPSGVVCCPPACGVHCGHPHAAGASADAAASSPAVAARCRRADLLKSLKPVCGEPHNMVPQQAGDHGISAARRMFRSRITAHRVWHKGLRCRFPMRVAGSDIVHTECVPEAVLGAGVPDVLTDLNPKVCHAALPPARHTHDTTRTHTRIQIHIHTIAHATV